MNGMVVVGFVAAVFLIAIALAGPRYRNWKPAESRRKPEKYKVIPADWNRIVQETVIAGKGRKK